MNFWLVIFYVGFTELSDSRQVGMGLGAIPWDVINAYCKAHGLDELQTEAMHYHLREMDAVYLNHHQKKENQRRAK